MTDAENMQMIARNLCRAFDEIGIPEPPDLIALASKFPTSSNSSPEIPDTSWVPDYFELLLHDGKPRPPIVGEWFIYKSRVEGGDFEVDFYSPEEMCCSNEDYFAVRAPAGAVAFREPKPGESFITGDTKWLIKRSCASSTTKMFCFPNLGRRRWIIDPEQREIALAMGAK